MSPLRRLALVVTAAAVGLTPVVAVATTTAPSAAVLADGPGCCR